MVFTKEYPAPAADRQAIARYALCRQPDSATAALIEQCLADALPLLSYRVCWVELPVTIDGKLCQFGDFSLSSQRLAKHLHGCNRAVIFAATVGVGMDRLIAKYSRLSPAKGLFMQAVGTERIEALCDTFCAELSNARPRFSPGYGDLKLETQKDIFARLGCEKRIGLTLNDSCVMSPSKSVTAIVGLTD